MHVGKCSLRGRERSFKDAVIRQTATKRARRGQREEFTKAYVGRNKLCCPSSATGPLFYLARYAMVPHVCPSHWSEGRRHIEI